MTTSTYRLRMRRAQVSVEFVIVLAGLLLMLIAMGFMFNHQRESAWTSEQELDAIFVGERIANAMHQVQRGGFNTSVNVFLPSTLAHGANYTIHIDNTSRRVKVNWSSYDVETPLLTSSFATQNITSRTLTVQNLGVITLG